MQLKDQYIESKYDPAKIQYDHPLLKPILKETYGVALYQEQVMQIVQGRRRILPGPRPTILRRAMGKKKVSLMAQQREGFLEGTKANNIDDQTAETLFARIEQFAGYGFNKSHSMAYAFVAYQTAYLKANYPVEFMAALLTSESGNLDKVAMYVEECRRLGIEVLPPDVNSSCYVFTVENDCIRFGLGAVKNVGEGPVETIVTERDVNGPFKDVFDFCGRVDTRQINHRVIESLNRAGAFAGTGWNRHQVDHVLDDALGEGQVSQRDRQAGQTSLLDLMGGDAGETLHQKPDLPEWPESELLAFEKEVLGLYVSSHPLAKFAKILERYQTCRLGDLASFREGQEVILGGRVDIVKLHVTQRGKKMAFITFDTLEGPCEVTVFADVFEEKAGLLVQDLIVMLKARVNFRNDEPSLLAVDVMPIEEAEEKLTRAVHIRLDTTPVDDTLLDRLAHVLGDRPGRCDVYLHCRTAQDDDVTVHATSACLVEPSPRLKADVEALLGEDTLWYSGGNGYPKHD